MDGDELPTRTGGWDFILGVSEDYPHYAAVPMYSHNMDL